MQPKIALVGRPNVGKSALFNKICQRRISIVDEQEGITRDRIYAQADCFGRSFIVIDTGGIDATADLPFNDEVRQQAYTAIEEADAVILVVDGQVGPLELDLEVARILLKHKKPTILAVNKVDRMDQSYRVHSFHSLGIPDPIAVSAVQGFQIAELMEAAVKLLPESEAVEIVEEEIPSGAVRVAIVGRPNVGKSTLLNKLLGEERAIVSPVAGTTRDSIDVKIEVDGQEYILVDTAGIRRKKAEKEVVDKFAAIRTQEALEKCDVCLLVLDSFEGITAQEKKIAGMIEELGKSCVLIFNKWDLVKGLKMEHALRGVREAVPFLTHCPTLFISANKGRNLDKIFPSVLEAWADRSKRIGTGALNKFIESCLQKYHPPLLQGKRLRIYYMTQIQTNPPKFVVFVNKPELMVDTYKKYLINRFRETYRFSGCPLFFELKGKEKTDPAPPLNDQKIPEPDLLAELPSEV
ncbi:MAG: ribosome biogenesis GTPase Der [Verrucomicrobia bacterium]|nr:ribosome biogenesis GTPase Der [Verrucomicrobiota bacterium]